MLVILLMTNILNKYTLTISLYFLETSGAKFTLRYVYSYHEMQYMQYMCVTGAASTWM